MERLDKPQKDRVHKEEMIHMITEMLKKADEEDVKLVFRIVEGDLRKKK